jgi:hypothetical protein
MTPCRTSFVCKAFAIMPRSECSRSSFLLITLTIICCFLGSSHAFVSKVSRFGIQDMNKIIRSRPNQAVTTANPLEQSSSSQSPRHSSSSVRILRMNQCASLSLLDTVHHHGTNLSLNMRQNFAFSSSYLSSELIYRPSRIELVCCMLLIELCTISVFSDN